FKYDKIPVIAGAAGFVLNAIFLKRMRRLYTSPVLIFLGVLILQFITWFWIAPDPRFVYGGLLCGVMLLPILFMGKNNVAKNKVSAYFLIILAVCILAYSGLKTIREKDYRHFLLPVSLPQPPVKEITVDHIVLRIPEKIFNNWNPRCYATPLPCVYKI